MLQVATSFDFPVRWSYYGEMANNKPTAKPSRPQELKGLWAWAADKLGIQPWGQILIIVLLAATLGAGGFVVSVEVQLASINATLANLPSQISSDTDAKLEHLSAIPLLDWRNGC